MEAQLIAAVIMLPFMVVFIYAGIHEYRRYKSQGRANYGLVYDEKTGTTFLTGLSEGEDAYDHEDFDPSDYAERNTRNEGDDDRA